MKTETWDEIWLRKGKSESTDLRELDGYEKTQFNNDTVMATIVKALGIEDGQRVPEVGCGAGALAYSLKKILPNIKYIGTERFQAKEPDGGNWSMRVDGPAQTLTLEPERGGGWQILSDPSNRPATLYDINLGPAIYGRQTGIRANDLKIVPR